MHAETVYEAPPELRHLSYVESMRQLGFETLELLVDNVISFTLGLNNTLWSG
jgi:hypothetical protein